jgi:hypothetical protein
MMQHAYRVSSAVAAVSAAALLFAPAANAYIGPGAGLTAIGTVIALIGGLVLGVIGFIWYPIKRLLRRRRSPNVELKGGHTPTTANTESSHTSAVTPKQET